MRFPLLLALLLLTSCQTVNPFRRDTSEAEMFGPASLRIHPIFTEVKDWTGDDVPDGIEVLIEFQDQFGDPTKAMGTVVFEIFEYVELTPDHRGARLRNPYIGSLMSVGDQQEHWSGTSRTYSFKLTWPEVDTRETYLVTATVQLAGTGRLFAQTIVVPQ